MSATSLGSSRRARARVRCQYLAVKRSRGARLSFATHTLYPHGAMSDPTVIATKLVIVPPFTCPKCGHGGYDMRGVGYNPDQLRKLRRCFRWAEDRYECLMYPTPEGLQL